MSQAGMFVLAFAALSLLLAPRAVFSMIVAGGGVALLIAAWEAGLNAGFMGVLGALVATSFIFGCSTSLILAIWASKN